MLTLLIAGTLTAIITTSIELSTYDSATRKNIFIAQAVIFSIVIMGLGFTASSVFGDDIQSKDIYMMAVVHAAVLLSVVCLSATIMSKLSAASSFGIANKS